MADGFRSSDYPLTVLTGLFKRRVTSGSGKIRRIPYPMLIIITSGEGILRLDGHVMRLKAGQVFHLLPSMRAELLPQAKEVQYTVLLYRNWVMERKGWGWASRPDTVFAPASGLPEGPISLVNSAPVLEGLERLASHYGGSRVGMQHVQQLFSSLLQIVCDEASAEQVKAAGEGILDESIAFMHRHYREKIRLDTLSGLAGLTPTSYSRSFKKAMGVSPVEYLNGIRIHHSKLLLNRPDATVSGTAQSAGFGNEFYFSRVFKRETGISPALYIKRKQLRIAVACCMRYEDCLRSMGVEPVCAMNGLLHIREPGQEETLAQFQQRQLEAIRSARPDVILADIRHQRFGEHLKQIAPTVMLEFSTDWRKVHHELASLVGREEEAKTSIHMIEQRIAMARRLLLAENTGRSFSYLRLYGPKIRVQGIIDHPLNALLYQELGLAPGSGVPMNEAYHEYEWGELGQAASEDMFVYDDPDRSPDEALLFSKLQTASAEGFGEGNRFFTASNWIGKS
ncbi:MAG: transcriptional regulator [Paenibacillaceae bacterium]|nr:transcriptional regulator [Paenibacillaceae bacterium]